MAASSAGTPPSGPAVKADVFKELDRRARARHAADHIKALIASGSLAPGDRLPPERELAVRLGVSRPTLREAVGALVIMGLLESRQGAGTFVARTADEATATGSPNATTVSIDIEEDPLGALFEVDRDRCGVRGACRGRLVGGSRDESARALAALEQAHDHERADRLAPDPARGAQPNGKFALGGQPVTGGQRTRCDKGLDVVGRVTRQRTAVKFLEDVGLDCRTGGWCSGATRRHGLRSASLRRRAS